MLNYSWRELGNRVGAWRLLELFNELVLPTAALINTALYDHCPELVARGVCARLNRVGHGPTDLSGLASRHKIGHGERASVLQQNQQPFALHLNRSAFCRVGQANAGQARWYVSLALALRRAGLQCQK